MPTQSFPVSDTTHHGYLALPQGGKGPGVLVCHAWWGLNQVFTDLCDRLAENGYVAFAPDLYDGKIATTIEEAETLQKNRDSEGLQAISAAALDFFRAHPAVVGTKIDAIGFSMGADYAILLDEKYPDAFAGIVLFYGGSWFDASVSRARYLAHFAEDDPWEPMEQVNKMQADNLQVMLYPNAGHWFFEHNRPDNYVPAAANLAWDRTLAFLRETLGS